MPESLKPGPRNVNVICTVCGLDYPAHGDDPTLEDCVRLLKAELARRPTILTAPIPWERPQRWPEQPLMPWQNPVICDTTSTPREGYVHAI